MKNKLFFITRIFFVSLVLTSISSPGLVLAQQTNKDEVEAKIEAKSQELKEINNEIIQQQKKLEETQSQKNSLANEVKKIDSNIKAIDLNIKSSKITIEKLDLEVVSLQDDISKSEEEVDVKQSALGEVLRQVQDKDRDGILFLLLKNKTLSESISEIQSLQDFNNNLILKIEELNVSKEKLNKSLDKTFVTKNNKEIERNTLQNKKTIADDLKSEKNEFLQETKNKEKVYQDSLKELEKKQLDIALEIEKMETELRSQINYKNLPKNLPGLLGLPVNTVRVTQEHGATKFAQKAYKGKWHNGLDFGGPLGDPIYASADGIVVAVENQDRYCYKGAYGKYVAIKHFMGLTTLYAHLSMYTVNEGDKISRGQIIGYLGKTGYATGPHLHFTVYDSETFKVGPSVSCGPKMPVGGDLNPRNYLSL
ncbi:MAG: peptidoglycan DD-metalloendopeptidase family protein [Candidatus Paceibacterota bacterium]|jgi:murein DD-endopeptidase MepM/ murein hydrolase activator NlpD